MKQGISPGSMYCWHRFFCPRNRRLAGILFLTSLAFSYFVWNVSLDNIFSTTRARALIFHRSISDDKNLSVSTVMFFFLTFDLLFENFNFVYNFSICSTSLVMVTSLNDWEILVWNEKLQPNRRKAPNKQTNKWTKYYIYIY